MKEAWYGIILQTIFNTIKSIEEIVSYYNSDEIKKIEPSVDKASGIEKRKYALLLLATWLGIRVSDIANLKFSNIDWEKNTITLYQYKTKASIE